MWTAGHIVYDYWHSFRELKAGTPEYIEMEHTVNERCAQKLYHMCE